MAYDTINSNRFVALVHCVSFQTQIMSMIEKSSSLSDVNSNLDPHSTMHRFDLHNPLKLLLIRNHHQSCIFCTPQSNAIPSTLTKRDAQRRPHKKSELAGVRSQRRRERWWCWPWSYLQLNDHNRWLLTQSLSLMCNQKHHHLRQDPTLQRRVCSVRLQQKHWAHCWRIQKTYP